MNRVKNKIILNQSLNKYKGNVHTHSLRSDGKYTPEEVVSFYRSNGYQFMCLSDHEIYFNSKDFDEEEFIMLAGYEMACEMSRELTGQQYHIHGLLDLSLGAAQPFGHDEKHQKPDYENIGTIQGLIDEMIGRGNMIIMNHPEWSKNREEDLLQLEGYTALEIYNHQSEITEAVGYGVSYWDYLLKRGKRVNGIASDDAHEGPVDTPVKEFFGGWIVVDGERLEQQSLIDAIKQGNYYSSNGPEIYDLRIEEYKLKIRCSPVQSIRVITHPGLGAMVCNRDGALLTEGHYQLSGKEQYVRIECVDRSGKTAWSNPIYPSLEEDIHE